MFKYTIIEAEIGETQEAFFEKMKRYSEKYAIDVYGLFNGVLYVKYYFTLEPEIY